MLTGYHPTAAFNPGLRPNNQRPAIGAVMAKKLGPRGSVPPYVCLPKMHPSTGPAYLGAGAAPFVIDADPNAPDFSVPDIVPPPALRLARLDSRRELLNRVDRFQRAAEAGANRDARSVNAFRAKAFDLMTSSSAKAAFDIHAEPDALNFGTLKNTLLPALDAAMATLFRDLADRGLLDQTLVVVSGEFGRTPRINKDAGRDHWGSAFTVALGGGGIKGGVVVGRTDARAEKPAEDPHGPEDLAATIHRCLGIDPDDAFLTPEGRPVKIVNNGRVIHQLI
jgi:hypothetical protein